MSFRIGNLPVTCGEPSQKCEFCGAVNECRPYGPKGEQICYKCAKKDPVTTEKMMGGVLFGEKDD